jgi:CRP-like cAMP-binding protein
MAQKPRQQFTPEVFLAKMGGGKTILASRKKQRIFSQGDQADAVFYIQAGKVKLTVVSTQGKEAVIAVLGVGSFFGESCLIGQAVRLSSATALEASSILRIPKDMMLQVLNEEPTFSNFFTGYLLTHSMRVASEE